MRRHGTARIVEDAQGRSLDRSTGACVWRADRDQLAVEVHDRRLVLHLEADSRGMTVWFPQSPTWDGGDPVSPADLATAREAILAVGEAWGTRMALR